MKQVNSKKLYTDVLDDKIKQPTIHGNKTVNKLHFSKYSIVNYTYMNTLLEMKINSLACI